MTDRLKPSRAEAADLILNSTVDPESRKALFEELGFTPPTDFTVTPFDQLILSQFIFEALTGRMTDTSEVTRVIQEAFKALSYEVLVTGSDIHHYFLALRGRKPGKSVTDQEHDQVTSASFPSIRSRYNVAVTLRYFKPKAETKEYRPELIGSMKVRIQEIVAALIVDGVTYDAMENLTKPKFSAEAVVWSIYLDLVEKNPNALEEAVQRGVDEFKSRHGITPALEDFLGEFFGQQRYLSRPQSSYLASLCNQEVCAAWLDMYRNSPDSFAAWQLQYMRSLIKAYIKYGPGEANKYLEQNASYQKLGGIIQGQGSSIVHFAFNLDSNLANPSEFLDALFDNYPDALKRRWLS